MNYQAARYLQVKKRAENGNVRGFVAGPKRRRDSQFSQSSWTPVKRGWSSATDFAGLLEYSALPEGAASGLPRGATSWLSEADSARGFEVEESSPNAEAGLATHARSRNGELNPDDWAETFPPEDVHSPWDTDMLGSSGRLEDDPDSRLSISVPPPYPGWCIRHSETGSASPALLQTPLAPDFRNGDITVSERSSATVAISAISAMRKEGVYSMESCGSWVTDLAAHTLTHTRHSDTVRRETCHVPTCEYHVQGFARRYDKQRHVLAHYKREMTCPFCQATESKAAKTFNRADIFKRHLASVHGVEQKPSSQRREGFYRKQDSALMGNLPLSAICSVCSEHSTARRASMITWTAVC